MKKNIITIIILFLCIISCNTQKRNNQVIKEILNDDNTSSLNHIRAIVYKIDSTSNSYVYDVTNDTLKARFVTEKKCLEKKRKEKIQIGNAYNFILIKNDSQVDENIEIYKEEVVDGRIIWTSKSDYIFFDSCLNICGNYILEKK